MIVRFSIDDWRPDEGEHLSPGTLGIVNLIPLPTEQPRYAPVPYLAVPTFVTAAAPAAGSKPLGLHVGLRAGDPIWHFITEATSGAATVTTGTIEWGNPPTATSLDNAVTTVTGSLVGSTNMDWDFGAQATAYGDFWVLAGDHKLPLQFRDMRTSDVLTSLVSSAAKPTGLFVEAAGSRLVIANVSHGGTSRADTASGGTAKTITGATAASPIVITSTAHGFVEGDLIEVTGVLGVPEADGYWEVRNPAANTFELYDHQGAASSGTGAYTSGGEAFYATSPSMIWFSGVSDPGYFADEDSSDWDAGKLSVPYEIIDNYGPITGIKMTVDGLLFVFKEGAIYYGDIYRPPVNWTLIESKIGLVHPQAAVTVEQDVFFYGSDGGFHVVGAEGRRSISDGAITRTILTSDWGAVATYRSDDPDDPSGDMDVSPLEETLRSEIQGFGTFVQAGYDNYTKTVTWFSGVNFSRLAAWVYNVVNERWSFVDLGYFWEKTATPGDTQNYIFFLPAAASVPGLGNKIKVTAPIRRDYPWRDILITSLVALGPAKQFPVYFWPHADIGILPITNPTVSYPYKGPETWPRGKPIGLRPIYSRFATAEAAGYELTIAVRVRTKQQPWDDRPAATEEVVTSNAIDADGFYALGSTVLDGNYHALEIQLVSTDQSTGGTHTSAANTMIELEGFDILYEEATA
jgi:hypothetical protein